jgi:hypothetical protein
MDKIKINATLEWAFLNKPNEMSGKYQVDLCNLSKNAVQALEEMGITVQYHEDKPNKGYYITCKSNIPIKAFDDTGLPLDAEIMIGNGSKATCVVGFYEWTFKNKKGVSPSLGKMVVNELVVYNGGNVVVVDSDSSDDPIGDVL